MTFLVKVGPNHMPSTTPVSEIFEPICNSLIYSDEVISWEPMLNLVDNLEKEWEQSGAKPSRTSLLLAADTTALYQNNTAEVVWKEVIMSNLNMEGLKWKEPC